VYQLETGAMNERDTESPAVMERSWPTGTLEERVQAALEELRPAIRMDGGDVKLLRIEGDVVVVHLSGACHGCPMAPSTLADFVSERIKLYAPEIDSVVAE
jgi:Fe-S cluster biogenesis protein NfuA